MFLEVHYDKNSNWNVLCVHASSRNLTCLFPVEGRKQKGIALRLKQIKSDVANRVLLSIPLLFGEQGHAASSWSAFSASESLKSSRLTPSLTYGSVLKAEERKAKRGWTQTMFDHSRRVALSSHTMTSIKSWCVWTSPPPTLSGRLQASVRAPAHASTSPVARTVPRGRTRLRVITPIHDQSPDSVQDKYYCGTG